MDKLYRVTILKDASMFMVIAKSFKSAIEKLSKIIDITDISYICIINITISEIRDVSNSNNKSPKFMYMVNTSSANYNCIMANNVNQIIEKYNDLVNINLMSPNFVVQ